MDGQEANGEPPGSERGTAEKRAETAGKYVIDGQEANGERLRNEQKPLGTEQETGHGSDRKRRAWPGEVAWKAAIERSREE